MHTLTLSKSGGTDAGLTRLLIAAGAPLRKSNAKPAGASEAATTTPDLSVCELNSSTRFTESVAIFEGEAASGRRGKTTLCLSCNQCIVILGFMFSPVRIVCLSCKHSK